MSKSMLRSIATRRNATAPVQVRYDPVTQTSQVLEDGTWVPSWTSTKEPRTKKADMETGEDEKGH